MMDMQGILREYLPLQLIYFGDVYADEDGDQDAWLHEYDFIWKPIVDSKYTPQLFLGDESVRFEPDGQDKKESINRRTGGQPLRMPKISCCWGSKSLLIANELADDLQFSDKLGITCSDAEVFDAAGHLHTDFQVFSFHKSLFHERFEVRFCNIPSHKRLLVCLELYKNKSTLFIHKSLFERWQKLNVTEVNYDIQEKYLNLETLMNPNYSCRYYGQRWFSNMDDFQKNQNGHIYE